MALLICFWRHISMYTVYSRWYWVIRLTYQGLSPWHDHGKVMPQWHHIMCPMVMLKNTGPSLYSGHRSHRWSAVVYVLKHRKTKVGQDFWRPLGSPYSQFPLGISFATWGRVLRLTMPNGVGLCPEMPIGWVLCPAMPIGWVLCPAMPIGMGFVSICPLRWGSFPSMPIRVDVCQSMPIWVGLVLINTNWGGVCAHQCPLGVGFVPINAYLGGFVRSDEPLKTSFTTEVVILEIPEE